MRSPGGTKPASLILVTGHTFGVRAFEGIFSSPAFLDGRLKVALTIGLDGSHAAGTVGYQSIAPLAAEQGVPHVSTADGRLTSLASRIRDAGPAYILVIGWSHLISPEVLAIPAAVAAAPGAPPGAPVPFGCIGMHPTRLPDGRGQAPIPWTIIKGYRQTALTVFFLEAAADTGPIIAQYDLDVADRETGASLFYRIAHAHVTAGFELAEGLASRAVAARAQDEATATRWPRRRPRDGRLDPSMMGAEMDALVRALLGPYPRAFVVMDGQQVPVYGVQPVASSGPGAGAAAPAERGGGSPAADGERRIRFPCADGEVYLLTAAGRE
jgi:methionyl-tRNA formyltransferase